jgi:hypothetical protein
MTTFTVANVSGTTIEFTQTMNLRLIKDRSRSNSFSLEQEWVNQLTGDSQWREVKVLIKGGRDHG